MVAPIAIVFNTILLIILLILVVICVKMWLRIFSLKKQKEFRKYNLEQLIENEKVPKQDLDEDESNIDHPNNL